MSFAEPDLTEEGEQGALPTCILWDPKSFHKRRARTIPVPKYLTPDETAVNTTAEEAVEALKLDGYFEKQQEYDGGLKGAILVIGGTDDLADYFSQQKGQPELPEGLSAAEAIQRLKLTFGRGLTRAALDTRSCIVTCGFDLGAIGFIGRANKDRHHKVPLIGVVGNGLTTWPGDTELIDGNKTTAGDGANLIPVQPDHTHYIMLDTAHDRLGVRRFRWECTKALIDHGGKNAGIPIVAVVVNGKEDELEETLACVRRGWPVALITGTGGIADRIANAMLNPDIDEHIPDEKTMEIVKEGTLETIDLKDIEGVVIRDLVKRLFGGGGPPEATLNMQLAWEMHAVYKDNWKSLAFQAVLFRDLVLSLGVLITCMCAIQPSLGLAGGASDIYALVLIVLPILVSVIGAIDSRFAFGQKARILTSAADSVESEIYVYRTGMGHYLSVAADKRNSVLADAVKTIRMNVMGTSVAEGSLKQRAAEKVKANNYKISDADNGLNKMAPEDYIQCRLLTLLKFYEVGALKNNNYLKRSLFVGYWLGGVATIIALWGASDPQNQLFVAIATAFMVAIGTNIENNAYSVKLSAYNRAHSELKNIVAWWRALTPIEQSNPANIADLVKMTETCRKSENNATNPGTDMTTGGGGGGGGGLDVESLVADIADNIDKDGHIAFARSWMDNYPEFFESYNKWLEGKLEQEVETKVKQNLREMQELAAAGGDEGPADDTATRELAQEDPVFQNDQLMEVRKEGLDFNTVQLADPDGEQDAQLEVPSIRWSEEDWLERETKVVDVFAEMEITEAILQMGLPSWMERHQGHDEGVKGVVLMVGVSNDLDMHVAGKAGAYADGLNKSQLLMRLRLIFTRGIIKAAIDTKSVIVTAGVDHGVNRYLGDANYDRHHKCPLIGISGKGMTTWPGDPRDDAATKMPVNKDHTHHFLLETNCDMFGVTKFRVDVAKELVKNHVHEGKGAAGLPVITFVINGSESTLMEVTQVVRLGWPICVVRGSGGAADEIANAREEIKDNWVNNPRLVEILKEGILECVNILDMEGAAVHTIISRLFMSGGSMALHDPNLVFAWEQVVKYASNSKSTARYAHWFHVIVLGLGVLSTCAVAFNFGLKDELEEAGADQIVALVVLLVPIFLTFFTSVNTHFKYGQRSAILAAAVEQTKSEIYQYRAGMGDYMNCADEFRNDHLAAQLKEISKATVGSVCGQNGLRLREVENQRAVEFRQSDIDNGFSVLSPDDYVNQRLMVEMKRYHLLSNSVESNLRRLQTMVFVLGGIGTGLAAVDLGIYVQIPVALMLAFGSFIEAKRYQDKLAFYNSAATQLESLLAWWRSLNSLQVANPLKYAIMVKTIEELKKAEIALINPAAGGGGGGGGLEHPTLNLVEFKSDTADAIQKTGLVKFKQGWVEKHMSFFSQYEDWLAKQGFFDVRTAKFQSKFLAEHGPALLTDAPHDG